MCIKGVNVAAVVLLYFCRSRSNPASIDKRRGEAGLAERAHIRRVHKKLHIKSPPRDDWSQFRDTYGVESKYHQVKTWSIVIKDFKLYIKSACTPFMKVIAVISDASSNRIIITRPTTSSCNIPGADSHRTKRSQTKNN